MLQAPIKRAIDIVGAAGRSFSRIDSRSADHKRARDDTTGGKYFRVGHGHCPGGRIMLRGGASNAK